MRSVQAPQMMAKFVCALIVLAISLDRVACLPDHIPDRTVLADLFNSMSGQGWTNTSSWLSSSASMCTWHGVRCDCSAASACRVSALLLPNNNVTGHLPISIGALGALTMLNLNANSLRGTLPASLALLKNLTYLDLGYAQKYFTANLPAMTGALDVLAPLINLEYLVLNQNQFVGPFPAFVCSFSKLLYLDMANNALNGSFPACIGQMRRLEWFSMAGNDFGGIVPPELALLTNLTLIDMSRNARLGGEIPPAFGDSLVALTYLLLQYTNVSVPTFMFSVYNTRLTGKIPACIGQMRLMRFFQVGNNTLEGELPDAFASLQDMRFVDVSRNRLIGSIPPSLGACQNLTDVLLSRNRFSSTLSPQLGNMKALKTLDVSSNALVGEVPAELGRLPALIELSASDNRLTSVSANIGNISTLQYLLVAGNALTALPVTSLQRLTNLLKLDISRNQLSGELTLFKGANIRFAPAVVNCSSNRFDGLLPPYGVRPKSEQKQQVHLMDVRGNNFDCPYPDFPPFILLQRSVCQPSFRPLLEPAYILTSGTLGIALGFLLMRRFTNFVNSPERLKVSMYALLWAVRIGSEYVTYKSLWEIIVRLQQPGDACAQANDFEVFSVSMPPSYDGFPLDHILSSSYKHNITSFTSLTFATMTPIIRRGWDLIPPHYEPKAVDAFREFCEQRIDGCSYDAVTQSCFLGRPDEVEFGGSLSARFLIYTWIVVALRLAFEFAAAAAVANSLFRGLSWSPQATYFVRTTTFAPLLWFRYRARFVPVVVLHKVTYADLLLAFAARILLVSVPLQVLNFYWLTRVSQSGLEAVTLLSILQEIASLAYLFFRFCLKWCSSMRRFGVIEHDRAGNADFESSSGFADEPVARTGRSQSVWYDLGDIIGIDEFQEAGDANLTADVDNAAPAIELAPIELDAMPKLQLVELPSGAVERA